MSPEGITRRTALKYGGLIALAAQSWPVFPASTTRIFGPGYGTDPDLLKRHVTWPLTLTELQLKALEALCNVILPAEPPHPSAAAIGVHHFINEWLSAPYPQMRADRVAILDGLLALEAMTGNRREVTFAEVDAAQQTAVFDRICSDGSTVPFARRLIELVCAGYYTTREGHAAIGYVGNVGLAAFPPPSPGILKHLQQALGELPERSVSDG